jgi:hypothetical protein
LSKKAELVSASSQKNATINSISHSPPSSSASLLTTFTNSSVSLAFELFGDAFGSEEAAAADVTGEAAADGERCCSFLGSHEIDFREEFTS